MHGAVCQSLGLLKYNITKFTDILFIEGEKYCIGYQMPFHKHHIHLFHIAVLQGLKRQQQLFLRNPARARGMVLNEDINIHIIAKPR